MKFAIITHVPHIQFQNQYFAYAPYVREMNVWSKYVDEFIIVAPLIQASNTAIDIPYNQGNIKFFKIESINLLGFKSIFNAFLRIPKISWQIFKAMSQADHIHLRCPGNIGLLGCLIQSLFPNKPKTAKYAGNWDPKAKQPWSYRLQKWILSNTFLTRNMQVLVYGEWEGSTKNIKPFFTATYFESDKMPIKTLDVNGTISFVFVGTLASGKNPLYAIQLVEALYEKGHDVKLDLYGEGIERKALADYIESKGLKKIVTLKGNQNQETVKKAYQNSHFVLLPSKSEGWPKALAEGMFWGCVPVATSVSCVPYMLDYGTRGLLLQMTRELCSNWRSNLEQDARDLEAVVNNKMDYNTKRGKASDWSRKYTLDFFDDEIKKMLKQ
jgi:glycosyltransferase involved in cell wall biosynthesis